MKQMKKVYIKHGARYMGLCDAEVYNNAPKTRYGSIDTSWVEDEELPNNYYFGNSIPCEYEVLKSITRSSFIALMDEQEFERVTQTLKGDNIKYVAYLSNTDDYV